MFGGVQGKAAILNVAMATVADRDDVERYDMQGMYDRSLQLAGDITTILSSAKGARVEGESHAYQ